MSPADKKTFCNPHSAIRNAIPSRHNNPFATCWTKPGAMTFRFPQDQSGERLIRRLAGQGWCGEIVGPHGSGKTTLLATLLPLLQETGRDVHAVTLRSGGRHLPRGWIKQALANRSSHTVLVVDGYEQLAPFRRWSLRRRCASAGAGLLVTSHEPSGLPTLVRLSPDLQLVEQLVTDLASRAPSPITEADVVASHACHGSNVREIFFELYDRHERSMRATRTRVACQA